MRYIKKKKKVIVNLKENKRLKKIEVLRTWDNIKYSNICVIEVPKGEKNARNNI